MEYAYSDNEETFYGRCTTIEAALVEALDDYPDDESVWVGEVTQKTIGGYFSHHDAENLLEQLNETAADECGEVTEDWLSLPSIRGPEVESRDERTARHAAIKLKQQEYLAPLVAEIRAALEKWATDNAEQPGFYHVGNAICYSREEAENIIAAAKAI